MSVKCYKIKIEEKTAEHHTTEEEYTNEFSFQVVKTPFLLKSGE